MSYIYRRMDNDQLVTVDFATMLDQKDGFILLPDGVFARRCVHLEKQEKKKERKKGKLQAEIVSDALGVTCHQVDEFRATAKAQGHQVEFTPDPHEPMF